MNYSIRIGFLIAILSVIIGAGIYQNFQVKAGAMSSIVLPENARTIISSQARSLIVSSWAGDLEKAKFFKQLTREPFSVNESDQLWPNQSDAVDKHLKILPPADVKLTEAKLNFSLVLGLNPKIFWPNSREVKKQVFQKNLEVYFPPQVKLKSANPKISFSPPYERIISQAKSGLYPHYHLYIIRPAIVDAKPQLQQVSHLYVFNSFISRIVRNWFGFSERHFSEAQPKSGEVFLPVKMHFSQNNLAPPISLSQQTLPLTPITVQSAALMGDVGHSQLVFRLSQQPFYVIRTDVSHQTITLAIDNVNSDLSAIPPLDTQGTAIQNISFNMTSDNQLLVTLTLLPQMEMQGLRYKDNNLVIDVGLGTQIPYVSISNNSDSQGGISQPLVKVPEPLTPEQLAEQNYGEAVDLYNQGNTQGAIGVLDMMLSQSPDFLNGRVLLANLLLQQGDSDKALKALLSANAFPNIQSNVAYYNLLAEAYRQSGQLRNAMGVYQQLLGVDHSNGVWWVGLGMCFEGLGQRAAADEAYQRAERTGTLSPVLQDFVLRKLGSTT